VDRDEATRIVATALADQTGLAVADVTMDLDLTNDLGLDSFDAVELLVVLERAAGSVLGVDGQVDNMITVGDVVDWLVAVLPGP
jgi:acyl carrier protein